MISWYVAHTQPLKEQKAELHLLEQGFEVYLPRFKKMRRHARKVDEVIVPLFPRYLFVGMNLEAALWRSVNGTPGVSYLLMNQERPALISSSIIDDLKAQESAEGLVSVGSLFVFAKGDKVRILEGTFKDHTAIFEKLDDKQRVHLLLSFMGRETKFSLPIYAVEAA
ncbi:MAG: transcriptional activator RfaH [Gammaproteobacteria bacterium]|nr:transcriptional activator RfaH [Gammaproteobacteria bacterium]